MCAEPSVPGVLNTDDPSETALVWKRRCGGCPPSGRLPPRSHTRPLGPRPHAPPRHVQIRQAAADRQPVGILRQPAVADVGPPEDPLDHQEHRLALCPNLRFCPVPRPRVFTQRPLAMRVRLDAVLGTGSVVPDHVALPAGGRIPPPRGSWPGSSSGHTGLSCPLADVAATAGIRLGRLSPPLWAFMPKYHGVPFLV